MKFVKVLQDRIDSQRSFCDFNREKTVQNYPPKLGKDTPN